MPTAGPWLRHGRAAAGRGRRPDAAGDLPDLGKLAQDWITLWQSELSAMAADREIHEILADHDRPVGWNDARPSYARCPVQPLGKPDNSRRDGPDTPGPLMRRGPRPLLLHLTLAMLRSNVSRATLPFWNADWPGSSVAAVLRSIQKAVQDGHSDAIFRRR